MNANQQVVIREVLYRTNGFTVSLTEPDGSSFVVRLYRERRRSWFVFGLREDQVDWAGRFWRNPDGTGGLEEHLGDDSLERQSVLLEVAHRVTQCHAELPAFFGLAPREVLSAPSPLESAASAGGPQATTVTPAGEGAPSPEPLGASPIGGLAPGTSGRGGRCAPGGRERPCSPLETP